MKQGSQSFGGRVLRRLTAQFFAGIVAVVPLGASVLILIWIFNAIDGILQPIISRIWGHPIPGAGFGTTLFLIYLAGVITSNVIGKKLIRYGESLLPGLPIFRQLYNGFKQILESLNISRQKNTFMRVIMVEFPRNGMWSIGFVTGELTGEQGETLLTVLIPTCPNPATGFLQIIKESDAIHTNMSVENAIKMVVSGGIISPKDVNGQVKNHKDAETAGRNAYIY